MEKQRLIHVSSMVESSLVRDDYEKWVWGGYSDLSAAFLQSPPDTIGYMEDNMFQVVMMIYLGQP